MTTLPHLFANTLAWAEEAKRVGSGFCSRLPRQQSPRYLWIGCAASRVPANEIVGVSPGEIFVHRNIANVVVHTDPNCLAVIQYAFEVLRVEHIIVCGHYGWDYGDSAAWQGPTVTGNYIAIPRSAAAVVPNRTYGHCLISRCVQLKLAPFESPQMGAASE